MGKFLVFAAAAGIGVAWTLILARLVGSGGLVSIGFGTLILNWVVVASLCSTVYFFSTELGFHWLGGWIIGQISLLIYDALPKGRSPQMFQPTNASEAILFGLFAVAVLSWSLLPGGVVGWLAGKTRRKK
jgi:hypothetical protein